MFYNEWVRENVVLFNGICPLRHDSIGIAWRTDIISDPTKNMKIGQAPSRCGANIFIIPVVKSIIIFIPRYHDNSSSDNITKPLRSNIFIYRCDIIIVETMSVNELIGLFVITRCYYYVINKHT